MASGGGCSRKPVRIVIIKTQYVETDASSFKSVVQKLTGKCSSDDLVQATPTEGRKAKRVRRNNLGGVDVSACASGHGSSFLIRDSLLEEYDRLVRDMPPLSDEFWSE